MKRQISSESARGEEPAARNVGATRAEQTKILTVAGRNAPVIQFTVATGLRVSEVVKLEWGDIRDASATISSKGKRRSVPLIQVALGALQVVPRHVSYPRVFWWLKTRNYAYEAFVRAERDAGVSGYTFHHLRHTYASWSAMAGCDFHALAKNMGISSLMVLRRYAHLSPSYRRSEAQKLSEFWGTQAAQVTDKSPTNNQSSQNL